MASPKRILLVFDKNRKDLFYYLSNDSINEYYLLFHERGFSKISPPNYIKEEFFWNDFLTPQSLLKKIKPDKIIFQEVFDLKQIALNITARKFGIETIFLDHGLWNDFESLAVLDKGNQGAQRKEKLIKLKKISRVISGYSFYFASITGVRFQNIAKFLFFPFIAFFRSLFFALMAIQFEERRPLKFILFSRLNFDTISRYYGCHIEQVIITGFPFFDSFANKQEKFSETGYIVFIDHPHLEDRILGWDESFHEQIARVIKRIADLSGKEVFIKLHPRSNAAIWQKYSFLNSQIKIIRDQVEAEFYLDAELIMGYASTLMVGIICATKNVVVVGWHPQPGIFGIDFSTYNVCHRSLCPTDVDTCLNTWMKKNLAKENQQALAVFTHLFNVPFDGKASERIIDLICA